MRRTVIVLLSAAIAMAATLRSPLIKDTNGTPVHGNISAEIIVYDSSEGVQPVWSGLAGPELPFLRFVNGTPANLVELLPAVLKARDELWIEIRAEGIVFPAERLYFLNTDGLHREMDTGDITETMDGDLILGETGEKLYIESDQAGFGDSTPNERITVAGAVSMQKAPVPPAASAGYGKVYVDDASGHLMYMDEGGTPTDLLETSAGGVQSVSSSANTTGRTEHMRFIPGESTEITESATDDTIYIRYDLSMTSSSCSSAPPQPDPVDGITPVCSGEPGTSYGVVPTEGATYYRWTLPTGSAVVAGFGTNIIHAYLGDYDGNICVKGVNACGESPERCFAVTINRPTSPGVITGPSLVCEDTTGLPYYIDAVPEATNYIWTLPPGATMASGSGTPSIVVNFGTEDGEVCVRTENSCGRSEPECLAVTTTYTPNTPGSISGSTNHCQYTTQAYSIVPVAEATNYIWTVPSGASISSGAGTTTIDVAFGTASGNICVQAQSLCGTSSSRCQAVTVINPPGTPGSISGTDIVSPNTSGVTYSISAVSGADPTGYHWYVSSGDASIPGATNTTSVSVNFGATSGPVVLCVTASNSCGTSSPQCRTLTVSVPSGNVTFNYTGGSQSWTVPTGVTSVTVDAYGASGHSSYGQGGRGGRVQATLSVTPGELLYIYVGGAGTSCSGGGYNGGASTSCNYSSYQGRGGGATDIRRGGTSFTNRILVAGGGGGCGYNWGSSPYDDGGHGGGLTGGRNPSCPQASAPGYGGTQSGGGAGGSYPGYSNGSAGTLGNGGAGASGTGGGGGGGGYYGGGGGSWSGGGGGSSYTVAGATGVVHTQGARSGNGTITISWGS